MSKADILCENVIQSKQEELAVIFTEKFIQVINALEQKKEMIESV